MKLNSWGGGYILACIHLLWALSAGALKDEELPAGGQEP